MILGRNTQQWMGLIGAAIAFAQLMVGVLKPEMASTAAIILGGLGVFAGVAVTFIANTYTTPVADPMLKEGTMVRVTDQDGVVIGHEPITAPVPEA
jgi:hypothetical protein